MFFNRWNFNWVGYIITLNKNNMKFKKSIKGAAEYYESIELYEDRLPIRKEFEASFKPEDIEVNREVKFYKWIRDNKL